eukprot:3844500-Pleurochrysis_carterae.AAC.1
MRTHACVVIGRACMLLAAQPTGWRPTASIGAERRSSAVRAESSAIDSECCAAGRNTLRTACNSQTHWPDELRGSRFKADKRCTVPPGFNNCVVVMNQQPLSDFKPKGPSFERSAT